MIQQLSRPQVLLILVISVAASIAWTLIAGQDLNFDLITYHYYLGYSAFVPRLHLDFLPAWVYAYQSPLPFVPLYWLDSMGTPPAVIAALYAAFHALSLVLLYLLTEILVDNENTVAVRLKVLAFWLLGAIAPIYWTLTGTSFADLLTGVPVLAGAWLIARAIPRNGQPEKTAIAWIAIGGLVIGAASGARIHNGVYAAGMFSALVLLPFPNWHVKVRVLLAFSIAAFLAALLCFAPWSYRLYLEFGSPLFPLFNGIFHSPDFPAANMPFISFIPKTFWELITLPFWMGTDTPWVYVELPLPDTRPAIFAVAVMACVILWLVRKGWARSSHIPKPVFSAPSHDEVAPASRLILLFFAASAVLWLISSGNGRFGVVLFLLGGPVCGVLLSRVLPMRYVLVVVAGVVIWQALLQHLFVRQYRFDSIPWTTRYFDWQLPERLKQRPATFLSFGFQPASTLAPRLHPESRHINIVGYPAPDAPGSERIRRIIGAAELPIYGTFDVRRMDPKAVKKTYGNQLAIWGVAFTDDACDIVMLKRPAPDWAWLNEAVHFRLRYQPPAFMVCSLQRAARANRERALSEYRAFASKVSRFGANCPQYFSKPLGYVHTDGGWVVTSFASAERRLMFLDSGPVYLQQTRPPHVGLELGRTTPDSVIVDEPDCSKWFSRLSELSADVSRGRATGE